MSRCIRSWAPLSWGHPGLLRSRSIPSASHHTESWLNPKMALLLAKGGPLSLRIAEGSPCVSKSFSKQRRITPLRLLSTALISSSILLNSSRTVSGSTRRPSLHNHHPLKSTVQTSLGASAFFPLESLPFSAARRILRGLVRPARSSTRLKLLSLGVAPGWPRS